MLTTALFISAKQRKTAMALRERVDGGPSGQCRTTSAPETGSHATRTGGTLSTCCEVKGAGPDKLHAV